MTGNVSSACRQETSPLYRLLVVTPRFWPLADDSIGRLDSFLAGLSRAGFSPTVLTPRLAREWPIELTYHEYEIHRPVLAARGEWSLIAYCRSIERWLRKHAPAFDLIYADSMRAEGALSVLCGDAAHRPTVVRCRGGGKEGDLYWAERSRANTRYFRQSLSARALIAPSAAIKRELVARGSSVEKIAQIEDGVPPPIRRDAAAIRVAREALAATNHDLFVPADARVILLWGKMESHSPLHWAVNAIAPLMQQRSDLRLWLFGDGSGRESLHRLCQDLGIRHNVAMPGSFGHDEEIYQAADLFVLASDDDGLEHRLPLALSTGTPVLVVDTVVTRNLFHRLTNCCPEMFPPQDSNAFQTRLKAMLADCAGMHSHALELRTLLQRDASRLRSIEQMGALFRRLIEDSRSVPPRLVRQDQG